MRAGCRRGPLIHSFLRVLDVNLGFRPEHAVTLRVDPTSNYDTKPKVTPISWTCCSA